MSTWVYEARDAAGKPVTGTHTANDRSEALQFLRSQGLFLTKLESSGGGTAARATPPKRVVPAGPVGTSPPPMLRGVASTSVLSPDGHTISVPSQLLPSQYVSTPIPSQPLLRTSSKDLSLFYSQLGAMIHAGTTLISALHIMSENAPNAALRKATKQIEAQILRGDNTGRPLSSSMSAFPGLFSPLHVGMVNAGERGGFLESTFAKLAQYAERDYEIQTAIKRETWYPKLLVFASIFIPSVVPLFLGGFNAWLRSVTPPILVLLIIYTAWRMIKIAAPFDTRAGGVRATIDGVKLFIPVVGKVTRGFATAKFCRSLSALYSSGVSISEAVKLAANACGNAAIASRAIEMITRLEYGETLTSCMEATGYFPKMAMQMMRVGEESGAIDVQLEKAADFLEADAETAIKQAIPLLGIIAFLLVGYQIGMQAIGVISGYGSMIDDLSK